MNTHPHHETVKLLKEWARKLDEAGEVKKNDKVDWGERCNALLSSPSVSSSEVSQSPIPEDLIFEAPNLGEVVEAKKSSQVDGDRLSDATPSSPLALPSEASRSQPPEDLINKR